MVPLVILPLFLMATSEAYGKSENQVEVNLKNPNVRLEKVERLRRVSREERDFAWSTAQKAGWKVRGETKGAFFELMAIRYNRPVYKITNNANAAISTAANLIRNTEPYNLNGSGLTVGIWDAGSVLSTHQEFTTRVSVMDGAASHWHSTHVGGTIGAAGVQPAAMGMAPSVDIDSYDWDSDSSEMLNRAASYAEEPGKDVYIESFLWRCIWLDNR